MPTPSPLLSLVLLICVIGTAACAAATTNWSGHARVRPAIHAQPAPGSWEMVAALPPGTALVVQTRAGDRIECTFSSVTTDVLTVRDRTGRIIALPTALVDRIVLRARPDGLSNGALIGAAAGLGAAAAILAAVGAGDNRTLPSAKVGAPILLSGAGGLVGVLIDRAHHEPERIVFAR